MPRPNDVGVGTAALIIRGGKVLLMKRQGSHATGLWAVSGGWIDRTDKNLVLAVKREVREEVGLEVLVDPPEPVSVTTEDHPDFRSVTLYYRCYTDGKAAQIMEPTKCSQVEWFTWEEIRNFRENQLFPGLYNVLMDIHLLGEF
jgi:8-oxo-dGTP diphosphatase